jgi:hypothetical protein
MMKQSPQDHAFSPEDVNALCHALTCAIRSLAKSRRSVCDATREALAKSIIQHAEAGEQAIDRLSALALADLARAETPRKAQTSQMGHQRQAARYGDLAKKAQLPHRQALLTYFQQARVRDAETAQQSTER